MKSKIHEFLKEKKLKNMSKNFYSLLVVLALSGAAFAQNTLKGKVYDENGKPLSGALIFEKGSMNGTTSANTTNKE